jgi:membrane-bound lytic murein transglycosylase B
MHLYGIQKNNLQTFSYKERFLLMLGRYKKKRELMNKHTFSVLFLVCSLLFSTVIYAQESICCRHDVQAFINHMVTRHHFSHKKLQDLFCHARINHEIISRMTKPAEAKPWYAYRDFFITPARIDKGVTYWRQHEKILALAEQKYGVPASIIVAIIGVETLYGENKGSYPVLDSLATLAFAYPPRSTYFKGELAQFLLLSREQQFNPLHIKGSYAGAMGLPQFMPSSYRHYAIDFSHKGHIDLINNDADAIGSIGNYLRKRGWKSGELVAIPATVHGNQYAQIPKNLLRPSLTNDDLAKNGIQPQQPLNPHQKTSFIRLQGKNSEEYWLGLQNFYVISTYNKSVHYVMVVNFLAERIRDKKNNTLPNKVTITHRNNLQQEKKHIVKEIAIPV